MRGKVRVGSYCSEKSAHVPAAEGPLQRGTMAAPNGEVAGEYSNTSAKCRAPRTVRMSRQGKNEHGDDFHFSCCVFAGCTGGHGSDANPGLGWEAGSHRRGRSYLLLPLALVAGIAFVMRRSLAQQRWLLVEGEDMPWLA